MFWLGLYVGGMAVTILLIIGLAESGAIVEWPTTSQMLFGIFTWPISLPVAIIVARMNK